MTREATHVSFEEFAGNLAAIFDRVTRDKETVLVEKEGTVAMIKPAASAAQRRPSSSARELRIARAAKAVQETAGALKTKRPFMGAAEERAAAEEAIAQEAIERMGR